MEVVATEVPAEPHENALGKLIKQGAEARVYETTFMGRKAIVKERFSKKYRHPVLDSKITQRRLNGEARSIAKARRLGVASPVPFAVDSVLHTITLEYIEGVSVKDILLQADPVPSPGGEVENIASKIGIAVARLHDGGLIHGDLTTSNMLISHETKDLVMIDFGLSFTSTLPEDKAVDLYVLERALLSLHSSSGDVMELILAAYKKSSKLWCPTMNKLAQVRLRGRKRVMIG